MIRLFVLVVLAAALAACATPYVITLKNGEVVHTRDEPEYDRNSGFYQFDDASGKRMRMNKDEIVSMEAR